MLFQGLNVIWDHARGLIVYNFRQQDFYNDLGESEMKGGGGENSLSVQNGILILRRPL